jgi:predicted RNA-binding Zn-ribbon protein involved in translation (DUF1610 family)
MIERYGWWVSDKIFEFYEPREIAPGMTMKSIDVTAFFTPDPDITPVMVVEAIINGAGQLQDVEIAMAEVKCPDCGQPGLVPADSTGIEIPDDGTVLLRCPACRDISRN